MALVFQCTYDSRRHSYQWPIEMLYSSHQTACCAFNLHCLSWYYQKFLNQSIYNIIKSWNRRTRILSMQARRVISSKVQLRSYREAFLIFALYRKASLPTQVAVMTTIVRKLTTSDNELKHRQMTWCFDSLQGLGVNNGIANSISIWNEHSSYRK